MTKGFIFTVDAALAASLAILLLFVAINLSSVNTGSYFGKLQLASIGNDFLAILDLNNTLDSYVIKSQTDISNDLQSHLTTLPPNYCANVSIFVYDYTGGTPPFSLDSQHSANVTKTGCSTGGGGGGGGPLLIGVTEAVKVKRVFITFDPEKYGKAEMVLWLK